MNGIVMILMNDFKAEPPEIRKAMSNAANRVIESGWYVLGKELSSLETLWAKTCGMKYGVGVGNGMDAIEIGLRILDIGPGDEVITTPMTAFATVLAILRVGATPVLADIEENTGLLSIESARRCVTSKTRAIVLVHLYGQVRNMSAWQEFTKKHGIELIEDCAQSHLATSDGKVAGSFGALGAYSFYPTKNLGALGDAGMLVTSNEEHAQRASRLRNYGQSIRYHHSEIGMNSRLDEMQAAILLERLKWLPEFTERRRQIAKTYRTQLKNPSIYLLAEPTEQAAHVYHLFVITTEYRDQLQRYLESEEIQALIHYPVTIHQQEPTKNLKRDPQGLIVSEKHADRCLSLPCHPQMSEQDVSRVIDVVNKFNIR